MEELDNDSEQPSPCVSYLQARDPSILSWNCLNIGKSRRNLNNLYSASGGVSTFKQPIHEEQDESEDCTPLPNHPRKKDDGINVYLRIKKPNADTKIYTIEDNTLICTVPEGSFAARNKRDGSTVLRKFKFSSIFDPDASQEYVFDSIIKEKIVDFINGNNSTVLAYGASGSGKTFTMIGTEEQPGIIPRSLDYFFRTVGSHVNKKPIVKPLPHGGVQLLTNLQVEQEISILKNILGDSQSYAEQALHSRTFSHMQRRLSTTKVGTLNKFTPIVGVWVSFAEIYNENIYDLLQPHPGRHHERPRLKIGGLQDDTYIKGLKYVFVHSGLEAYRLMHYGMHNLSYAATAVNEHSSRSHCIFSIRLVAGYDHEKCKVSIFNFCDLAGSERLKKTLNIGERLRESNKINSSLSVLGRCISSIRDMQQKARNVSAAPFRDSKLTILFQKALQGKENISMIVNINPSPEMYDDTQHVLTFSAIAQEITTKLEPQFLKRSRYSAYNSNISKYVKEEEQYDEQDEEIRRLRYERADLVLEISQQKERFNKEIEEERNYLIENHEKVINLISEQVKNLKQKNKELEKSKAVLEQQIRQLKRELIEKDEDEVIVLSSSEESADEEGEDKNKNLEWKIADYQQELEELKVQNKKLKEEIKQLDEKYQELHKINREQSEEIEDLKHTLFDSKKDFALLSSELEKYKKSVQELTSEILLASDEGALVKDEIEFLRQQNHKLREEREKLESLNEKTQPLESEDSNRKTGSYLLTDQNVLLEEPWNLLGF
ncbi:unnamed protein product [Ceutorhynchus assimilis]|uniref:Kinesin motor domain-containing protein n=1 Tax=Ceutorhynchus assimilis TaxID=467358 RepID=A0A9N9MXC5_9CUCU|nr:unnamed protein product [Ceutorhynchus assimilis]